MFIRYLILSLLSCIQVTHVLAQAIDNTLSYKNINTDRYVRINYENDFFSGTDIYYTQGIHIEAVSPFFKKNPISKILFHPRFQYVRYGIGMEHDGYTPTNLGSDAILYGDRPFTACLFLKSFVSAIDPVHEQRFSAALSTGVIGQAAGGMGMQTSIHRWLHDIIPHGWQNQIHNDVVLNYRGEYEKQLAAIGNGLSIDADATADVGTLSDKASIGATIMTGLFDQPFSTTMADVNHFRIYAYEHPQVNVVGFDATLQGGMFDRTSPYTISSSKITRATFQNSFGFVIIYKKVFIEYFQSIISNEFKTGTYHVWGGVQVAFGI